MENLETTRLICHVTNNANSTLISAKTKDTGTNATLRIDWQTKTEKPENFRNHPVKDNALISTHRIGEITVTRTILASATADCILIHIIADQPGAVSFSARFVSDHPSRIRDRREIILSGDETQAHAWIIPFESDVHDGGKGTIFLNGEGEALIILNLTADAETSPIADTLTRLGKKYDPDHSPASPHLIWKGLNP